MDRMQRQLDTSPIIVDIQCFIDNYKEYILKEVCVVEKDTGVLLMYHIARPPYRRSTLLDAILRINYRLTKRCHGIPWDCGDISYHELYAKLTGCISSRTTVYVKGAEKKEYLKQHHVTDWSSTNVIDVYDIGCASLSSITKQLSSHVLRCNNHNSTNTRCALTHCLAIRGWLHQTNTTYDESPTGRSINGESCFCSCFHNATTTTNTAVSAGYDTVDAGGA